MCCRDFQYEFGVQYDMPEDQEIEECVNGFHLCLNLSDVFGYYYIGDGNRFFKVKALVRKSDKDKYGSREECENIYGFTYRGPRCNTLAAKSIILQSELTVDEVLRYTEAQDLPEQYKRIAMKCGVTYAVDNYYISTLIEDGYSEPFAAYIVQRKLFDAAYAFGSQKDLSMDMKVLGILYNK